MSRSAPSMTVTSSAPSRRNACAISAPIAPPPSTSKRRGTSFAEVIASVVPRLDLAQSGHGRDHRRACRSRARPTRACNVRVVPSGCSTSTRRSPASRPRPRTSSMSFSSSHGPRPRRSSRSVMSVAARERGVGVERARSSLRPRRARVGRRARTSPGRISVLLGMQPQYEHSPPTSSASTIAVRRPPSAQRPGRVLARRTCPDHHHVVLGHQAIAPDVSTRTSIHAPHGEPKSP